MTAGIQANTRFLRSLPFLAGTLFLFALLFLSHDARAQDDVPEQGDIPEEAPSATEQDPASGKEEEETQTLLVVGDFLAGSLADGLKAAYEDSPNIEIVERSNGSSGFVRQDYYDWNGEIGPILEEVRPTVVLVMVGANDRQQLVVDGQRANPLSDPWREEYAARTTAFAEKVKAAGIPIIWTGLPPFKFSSMTSDMLAINDIQKNAVETVEGTFVDIWAGFVNENGDFIYNGPDVNGQNVTLRASDGINMTRAGERKIAFYVEKPLNKVLQDVKYPEGRPTDWEAAFRPDYLLGELADTDRTKPISLTGPDLENGTDLLGGFTTSPIPRTILQKLPEGKPGRADFFSLRPQSTPMQEKEVSEAAEQ